MSKCADCNNTARFGELRCTPCEDAAATSSLRTLRFEDLDVAIDAVTDPESQTALEIIRDILRDIA